MPSARHETLVTLVRDQPSMLVELIRDAVALPRDAVITLSSESGRQLASVEVRADAVLVLDDGREKTVIIAEVQLQVDPAKRGAWPCYATLLHRDFKCPVLVVVLAIDPDVAAWCGAPIDVGGGFVLRPIVVGPSEVPSIDDPAQASTNVELAVLSSLAHSSGDESPDTSARIAFAAIHAIASSDRLDEDRRADYFDVVVGALGAAARRVLEGLMSQAGREYVSDFAREYFAKGRAEGEAKGRAEGEAEALLAILAARGLAIDPSRAAEIRACRDVTQLESWIRRAAVATSLSDVFD